MIEMLMAQMGIDPAQIKKQINEGVAAMQDAAQTLRTINIEVARLHTRLDKLEAEKLEAEKLNA